MITTIRRAVLLAAALAAPAAAQSAAEAGFNAAAFGARAAAFRPTLSAEMPALTPADVEEFKAGLKDSTTLVQAASFRAAGASLVAAVDLAPILNQHLKTSLRFTLGGRTVWFSGAFDRQQNPFVSVLIDGYRPMYFNVKALLDQDQRIAIGSSNYTLSLSANIFHKMKSKINLVNDDNSRDAARFSVQDMLDAVDAAGRPVALSDQSYKFYYADGVGGSTEKMFVFIYGNSHDFHVFLVGENSVPSDKLAVFQMFNGKRVGLAKRDGKLEIYENP